MIATKLGGTVEIAESYGGILTIGHLFSYTAEPWYLGANIRCHKLYIIKIDEIEIFHTIRY